MKTEFIKLKNKHIELTLSTLGASIYQLSYDGEEMVMTPVNQKDFDKDNFYQGKTIGRVCGRIVFNDIVLHGGVDRLSKKQFSYVKEDSKVTFSYLSKDGESGYPGNLLLKVIYELFDDSVLLKFEATTDKSTLLALTNHAYFCLGEDDINKISVKMNSNEYIVTDDELVPIKFDKVPAKYDFHEYKTIKESGQIDNYFSIKPCKIQLKSAKIILNIESDFEGAVLFTDHFDDGVKTLLSDKTSGRALAVEPQDNQLDRKELHPNEVYRRYIKYTFEK